MDKERKTEIWVGVTVTAALLILVLGVIWGKGSGVFSKQTRLVIRFQDVRGLEKGDPVYVRGIEVGRVSGIVLESDYAEVQLRIPSRVALFSDVSVLIEDKDLMGAKGVTLIPGEGPERLDANRVLVGAIRMNTLDMLTGAQRLIAQTDSILGRFRTWVAQGTLDRLFDNMENTSREANRILAENRQSIRTTIARLEDIAKVMKDSSTAERLGRVVTRMDTTLLVLNRIVTEAEKADGTLGKLIRDKNLYDRLVKTSTDLDSLINDFKRDPKRYINVSIF
ncbi:MAG TPA: MlaD family protein [bacterium]